jgi:hypothetical protein
MDTTILKEFPQLLNPPCETKTKFGMARCGYCTTARSIANGMGFVVKGERLSMRDGIAYNLNICAQRLERSRLNSNGDPIDEIRREGGRILKKGTNVFVQLKAKKGTARSKGYVVECYENNKVRIFVNELGTTKVVEADEFVIGRKGITKKEQN